MFIMRRMGRQELQSNVDHGVVDVYNKMHVGFRVQVEWGISGLKQKWKCLMKRFDATKPNYPIFSKSCVLLTNYLHCHRMDFTYKIIGDQNLGLITQG
jgi:hypothetical protein